MTRYACIRVIRLLSSGLYRRPRSFTGSCAGSRSRAFTAGREWSLRSHPAPKAVFQFSNHIIRQNDMEGITTGDAERHILSNLC